MGANRDICKEKNIFNYIYLFHLHPTFLPDGDHFLVTLTQYCEVVMCGGPKVSQQVSMTGYGFEPEGHFVKNGNIFKIMAFTRVNRQI